MLQHAHAFVRLHSRLQDGVHLSTVTVDPDGEAMLVTVLSRERKAWRGRFTESDVEQLKTKANPAVEVPWGTFFELLQRAYIDRALEFVPVSGTLRVQLKHERPTDAFNAPGFSVSMAMTLSPHQENGRVVESVVDGMLAFLSLRNGEKREVERVEEVCRQDEQLKAATDQVLAEAATLKATAEAFTKTATEATAQATALEAKATPDAVATAKAAAADPAYMLYGVRQPAGIDALPSIALLRAVKSLWPFAPAVALSGSTVQRSTEPTTPTPEEDVGTGHLRYCDVVSMSSTATGVGETLAPDDDAALDMVRAADDWSFDVAAFDAACRRAGTSGLQLLGYTAFMRLGLCSAFNISERALLRWLAAVDSTYRDVPFHCALHAVDTLHAVFFQLVVCEGRATLRPSDEDLLALLIAAVCIDVDHPGLTNDFLRREGTSVAARTFAGQPVLECHHSAVGFGLMNLPGSDVLQCVAPARRAAVHLAVTKLIVATDLTRHESAMAALTRLEGRALEMQPEETPLVLAACLKAGDVAYTARSPQHYAEWAARWERELEAQLAQERAAGWEPSVALGTAAEKKAAQRNMLHFVTVPLYAALLELIPGLRVAGDKVAATQKQLTL